MTDDEIKGGFICRRLAIFCINMHCLPFSYLIYTQRSKFPLKTRLICPAIVQFHSEPLYQKLSVSLRFTYVVRGQFF
jgi:hypothetical protein